MTTGFQADSSLPPITMYPPLLFFSVKKIFISKIPLVKSISTESVSIFQLLVIRVCWVGFSFTKSGKEVWWLIKVR